MSIFVTKIHQKGKVNLIKSLQLASVFVSVNEIRNLKSESNSNQTYSLAKNEIQLFIVNKRDLIIW